MNQSFSFAADHWLSAVAIVKQRWAVMASEEAQVTALLTMERLLRVHAHVLGQCSDTLPAATTSVAAFVRWAALFQASDPDRKANARQSAIDILVKADTDAEGAFWALALFPLPEDEDALAALYQSSPVLRARLFFLWQVRGTAVPQALVHQAVLKDRDELRQQAALAYAAASPDIGVELFERFYDSNQPNIGPGALAVAIWGGMARGDTRAVAALRRAIEMEPSPDHRSPLLLLAALSGSATLLPVLVDFFHSSPEKGGLPLAIHGSREAVRVLVDAMSQAETMHVAAQAWQWASGVPVPEKPRLVVAGDMPSPPHAGTMPDGDKAREIWESISSPDQIDQTDRFLFGRPLDLKWLIGLCRTRSGVAGGYLLDLLVLELGRPLGFHSAGWHHQRITELNRIEETHDGRDGGR